MYKDILIKCLKTMPAHRGKIIVDVTDIREIGIHGWDFTLTYRLKDNPFDMREVSYHNWISTDFYNSFAVDYLANVDKRIQKLEEIRIYRQEMDKARNQYDEFMNSITVEVESIKQFNITVDNFDDYKRIQNNFEEKRKEYAKKLMELQSL